MGNEKKLEQLLGLVRQQALGVGVGKTMENIQIMRAWMKAGKVEAIQDVAPDLAVVLMQELPSKLKKVNFSGQVEDKLAATLQEILVSENSLEVLNLDYCEIGDQGLKHIAKGLKEHKKLEVLSLQGNTFGPKAIEVLAAALEGHPSLRILDLSGNPG